MLVVGQVCRIRACKSDARMTVAGPEVSSSNAGAWQGAGSRRWAIARRQPEAGMARIEPRDRQGPRLAANPAEGHRCNRREEAGLQAPAVIGQAKLFDGTTIDGAGL